MTSLLDLGSFVLQEIVMFVPPRERFQNVAQTCRRLFQICSTRRAWRGQFFELESTRTLNGKSHPTHNHSASLYTSPLDPSLKQMFVYGGNLSHNNVIEKIQNELWCFDFASKSWSQSVAASPSRTEHSSVIFENNLYVFGGYGGNYLNNLLALPLPFRPENGLVEIAVSGDVPPPRSAHSLVVYNEHMYCFGGWRGIQAPNSNADLYKLSFRERKWSHIPAKGEVPSPRRVHNAIVYKDSMFVFGGFDEKKKPTEFNDTYRFDFLTEEWSRIECRGDVPFGRSRSTAVQWGRFMYVLGGWDRVDSNAELFELDLETYVWREVDTNLRDLQVNGIQAHSCVVLGDWLVTFGGKSGGDKIFDQMFACRLGRNRTHNRNISPPESGSESE